MNDPATQANLDSQRHYRSGGGSASTPQNIVDRVRLAYVNRGDCELWAEKLPDGTVRYTMEQNGEVIHEQIKAARL